MRPALRHRPRPQHRNDDPLLPWLPWCAGFWGAAALACYLSGCGSPFAGDELARLPPAGDAGLETGLEGPDAALDDAHDAPDASGPDTAPLDSGSSHDAPTEATAEASPPNPYAPCTDVAEAQADAGPGGWWSACGVAEGYPVPVTCTGFFGPYSLADSGTYPLPRGSCRFIGIDHGDPDGGGLPDRSDFCCPAQADE